jgi:transforming growth factor-beta-induced protein
MIYRRSIFTLALATVLGYTLSTALPAAEKSDIVDTAVAAGSFKTLAAALQAADLVDALKSDGPFTVFAPTDEAFAKLPKGTVANLLKPANRKQLVSILTYHVVKGNVPAKAVVSLNAAQTLNGQRVDIKVKKGTVMIDGARVVKADIACSNGTIHVIDQVILPTQDNVPSVAVKAGNFKTLVAAVKAAGLLDTLAGKGPFTVFAPTDKAFAKLPEGTVESLLKPENKGKLVEILKYHVVSGRVYSDAALKAGHTPTLQGSKITIAATASGATVNKAKLLATDIDAANGVIHVIDSVLIPSKSGKTSQRMDVMLENAVARGSQLYNTGHPKECAQVYAETMRTMISSKNHNMSRHTVRALKMVLYRAEQTDCDDTRAWMLRQGMDLAHHRMMRDFRVSRTK